MARRAPPKPSKPTKSSKRSKKSNGTISTSRIFKPNKSSKRHTNSHVSAFKKAVSNSRAHILTTNPATLAQSHTTALTALNDTKTHYTTLTNTLLSQKTNLLVPLPNETYTIVANLTNTATTNKDGGSTRPQETVMLGSRVQAFKRMVETKEAEIARLWEEWSHVQEELSAVFVATEKGKGERLVEEFKGLEEEVKQCAQEAVQMMRESETELDLHRKTQQKKFLTLISDM